MIAALYIDETRSPYYSLGVDCWPLSRDATKYDGTGPVIAHPPCGPHGKYHAHCNQDFSLAEIALCQVRKFGGIFEHPVGSAIARQLRSTQQDLWRGYTIEIDQFRFGFDSLKPTVLYIVRPTRKPPLPQPRDGTPTPFENLARTRRHLTPPLLAKWLIEHFC